MYAVILAGGVGERFWPLSRRSHPKQFLPLIGSRSTFRCAVDRLAGLVDIDRIVVVTGEPFYDLVRTHAPDIDPRNILLEPEGKDTAVAIGLASEFIYQMDPHAVILVLPADHYIGNTTEFQDQATIGLEAASSGEWIVTLGIKPSRPETGFGYIRRGPKWDETNGVSIYISDSFHEKPDYDTAIDYLHDGRYLWNSGMYMARVDLFLKLFAEFMPELSEGLKTISDVLGTHREREVIREVYVNLCPVSIDYGIAEKTDRVLVIPVSFPWDDVGTWVSLAKYNQPDEFGNVFQAQGVVLDSQQCIVYAQERVVALLGLNDLLVVDDPDCLLICDKNRSQEIKKVVRAVREKGFAHLT